MFLKVEQKEREALILVSFKTRQKEPSMTLEARGAPWGFWGAGNAPFSTQASVPQVYLLHEKS